MRGLIFLYGTVSYILFLLATLYMVAFVGDFLVPATVAAPPTSLGGAAPWIIDIALVSLFGLQHSIMARGWFKNWLTGWLSPAAERSTYVLMTSLIFILIFWLWQPLPGTVWDASGTWGAPLLWAVFTLGWLVVLTSTFAVNHFDLFGLRQIWLNWNKKPYTEPPFKENPYYKLARHPMMLGIVIAFWAIPVMTVGHLLFAITTTVYIFIGIHFEERGLAARFGDEYRNYQRQVPMLLPWPRPRGNSK